MDLILVIENTVWNVFCLILHYYFEIFTENCVRHELPMTGRKCWLPDMMFRTGQIIIPSTVRCKITHVSWYLSRNIEISYLKTMIWPILPVGKGRGFNFQKCKWCDRCIHLKFRSIWSFVDFRVVQKPLNH